jgi:hypothetical protein
MASTAAKTGSGFTTMPPAPVRFVVGDVMAVRSPIADVVQVYFSQPRWRIRCRMLAPRYGSNTSGNRVKTSKRMAPF